MFNIIYNSVLLYIGLKQIECYIEKFLIFISAFVCVDLLIFILFITQTVLKYRSKYCSNVKQENRYDIEITSISEKIERINVILLQKIILISYLCVSLLTLILFISVTFISQSYKSDRCLCVLGEKCVCHESPEKCSFLYGFILLIIGTLFEFVTLLLYINHDKIKQFQTSEYEFDNLHEQQIL